MAEYIDREKARDAVYARIDELKDDKEFNMAKEICISGVKKHIRAIPSADVIEREKIDNSIKEINDAKVEVDFMNDYADGFNSGLFKTLEILKKNVGE